MTPDDIRSTRQWRNAARRACPPGSICYICGEPIRYDLPRNHRLGPSADHVIPLVEGGAPFDPANLMPAHRGCNSAKAGRPLVAETWSDW